MLLAALALILASGFFHVSNSQANGDFTPTPPLETPSHVAEQFLNASYYQNGHGIIVAMPKVFHIAKWIFPGTFGTNGEDLLPLRLYENPILNLAKARQRMAEVYGFTLVQEAEFPTSVRVVGMQQTRFQDRQVFVAGCASCHSSKAAGRYYVGLGSKNIDPFTMSEDSLKLLKAWGKIGVGKKAQEAYQDSLVFSELSANPSISNLSQGLVATSVIKSWVYRELKIPFPNSSIARGVVKPPHLWGLEAKKKVGFSANGEGRSQEGWIDGLGWMMGAEMAVSGHGASHIKESESRLIAMYELTKRIQPPVYPFAISLARAQRGKEIFTKNCMSCHQAHERDVMGLPIYLPPKRVPIAKVGTDSARTLSIDEAYLNLVSKTAWNELVPLQKTEPGYLAPQLWGIWARFPYLHNASVPTLYEMMIEPSLRAQKFSLVDAGEEYRYDPVKGGLTQTDLNSLKNLRALRNTSLPEQSNQGHYFPFMKSFTDEDRYSVIEYLKTL